MESENEIKAVFKPEHIGQPVHCAVRGNGLITRDGRFLSEASVLIDKLNSGEVVL